MPVACVCMCLPDTLSRVSLCLGLASLLTLAASVATDHWLYTSEPVVLPNTTNKIGIRFRSGLWRACPAGTTTTNLSVVMPQMSCTKIPYFKKDFQLLHWTQVSLTTPFLKRMRLCTPFLLTSLALLVVGTIVSLIGHAYADNRTFVAAIIFILAGLIMAVAIVLYITMITDEVRMQSIWDARFDDRYSFRYGWSLLGAGVSFVTGELAAVAGISAYLQRFPTADDIVRLIPGMHRRLMERTNAAAKQQMLSSASVTQTDLATTPKRDMTMQTFDSIAVPV